MPRRDAVEVLQMSEKCILLGKAQAVGEAEERVFNNGNRRAGTKGKGSKEPATVVRKESSVSKPLGKAARMGEDPPLRKEAEMIEVPLVKAMIPKVSPEVLPVKAVTPKVFAEMPPMTTFMPAKMPSMASPMPTKSLYVSC